MSTVLKPGSDAGELENLELGQNIRAFRQAGALTLDQFASAAGISRSLLSQVERGKATPSLATLRSIAHVLGVPIAALFAGGTETDGETDRFGRRIVVRRDERRRLERKAEGICYDLLTPDINRKVEFLKIEISPGAKTPETGFSEHDGEENQYCIEGDYVLEIENQEFEIHAGDSASFDSSVPHIASNRFEAKAVLLIAITPPNF